MVVDCGEWELTYGTGTFQDGELITDNKGGSALNVGAVVVTSKQECCFELGGCGDPLRPYPPPRQTPLNVALSDLDPSLAYDIRCKVTDAQGHSGEGLWEVFAIASGNGGGGAAPMPTLSEWGHDFFS